MSAQNHKTRPARNNSLQRMLELERRFMMERRESSSAVTPTKPGLPNPVSSTPAKNGHAQTTHFAFKTRRPETQTYDDPPRPGAKPVPYRAALGQPPQHPPLTLNTAIAQLDQQPPVARTADMVKPTDSNPNVQPPERLSSKVVSFNIPAEEQDEERGSICQSPSWEAYDRRKKDKLFEKKDVRKELQKEPKKELKKEPKEIRKEREKELEQAKARLKEKERENQKEKEREKQRDKEREKQRQKDKEKLKEWQKQKEKEEREKEKEKQRGREKEREKEKEKEKEKSRSLLTKTKRLSKTPPMSSIHAIDHANRMSRSLPTPPPDSSRPGSSAGRRSSSRDDSTNRRTHSRSSSISSLFRRPFETRRNSIEDAQDIETGFIGGIKLEMERHAALQKALDEQLKADKGEEADIHPALRDDKQEGPQNPEAGGSAAAFARKAADAQRRAYPPITRLTAAAKTRSLVLPSPSETAPEAATIDRWKAFVGIKTSPKQSPVEPERTSRASDSERPGSSKGVETPTSAKTQQASPPVGFSSGRPSTTAAQRVLQMAQNGLKDKQIQAPSPKVEGYFPKDKASHPMMIQTDIPAAAFDLPKLSPPLSLDGPLEPPARSPKRDSTGSTASITHPGPAANHSPNCSSSSRFSSSNTSAKGLGSSQDDAVSANSSIDSSGPTPNGGGVPLDDNKPPSPPEGPLMRMPTWNEIRSTVVQAITSNVNLNNVRMSQGSIRDDSDFTVRRLTGASAQPGNSSDDMSYDEFHSPSLPGTPDTSRAQSEKGAIPLPSEVEQRLASQADGRPGSRDSRRPTRDPVGGSAAAAVRQQQQQQQRSQPNRSNLNVGATAEVPRMAMVNVGTPVLHMPQGRAIAQIRVTSETGVTQEPSFLPKLKHQPLRPGASPTPSRETMAAPASYLEEARKATPLAPPPSGLRSPSLAPRAGGSGALRTPPASVRSNPSSLNISGIVSPSGDPVAKMFVECCGCKYYHDMPSDLYEVMANPEAVISPRSSSAGSSNNLNAGAGAGPETSLSRIDLAGLITMRVRCPWCSHEMSTRCCAGYAAMVYLKQRLH